jgi:hypothetical protein
MENIMELRCVLEEGRIVKHIITSALILAAVEAAIVAKCLFRWVYNR